MKQVVVYGTGGHAKVIVDILRLQRRTVAGVLNDDSSMRDKPFCGTKVLGGFDYLKKIPDHEILVAVGDNPARRRLAIRIATLNRPFATAVHPSAQLAESTQIGVGSVVMAQVAVNADATVGQHVILNTGCTIDHDCLIGDFAHISPGAHLAGGVRVGAGAHLGVGVSVIPQISIGEGAVVGAGAAVVRDVPPHCTVVGVPASVIRQQWPPVA